MDGIKKLYNAEYVESHHSSVDPSVPTIMQPWVRSPSTTSTLFQFVFESWWENDKNKQKEAVIGQFLNKQDVLRIVSNLELQKAKTDQLD